MNPTIDSLHNPLHYETLDVWEHANIVHYVQQYLWQRSLVSFAYLILTLLSLASLGIVWALSGLDFFDGLGHVGLGIAGAYLLIIPHEHIHGWTYRVLGCKNIRIVYNLRQLTALCIADREAVSGKSLMLVAIAPFLALTSFMLFALIFLPYPLFILGALAFHTAACSGDAAIINYLWLRREEQIFTYDDANEKKTYFFKALSPTPS